MQVSLVSITESLIKEWEMTPEQLIVYIARVSNPSNQHNTESSERLINYLIKHKHWSPFEMIDMTIEIVTSRAIAQQILIHRSFSFQEFSQRYATATEIEPVLLRKQAEKNRQSSTEEITNSEINTIVENHIKLSEELYSTLIQQGIARECARMVLPLTTQTTMYMKGSIRSWIHYLQLRCEEDTQLEHREIADSIKEIFKQHFPNVAEAIGWTL
jgi:thymidylate synthase (FAD)